MCKMVGDVSGENIRCLYVNLMYAELFHKTISVDLEKADTELN